MTGLLTRANRAGKGQLLETPTISILGRRISFGSPMGQYMPDVGPGQAFDDIQEPVTCRGRRGISTDYRDTDVEGLDNDLGPGIRIVDNYSHAGGISTVTKYGRRVNVITLPKEVAYNPILREYVLAHERKHCVDPSNWRTSPISNRPHYEVEAMTIEEGLDNARIGNYSILLGAHQTNSRRSTSPDAEDRRIIADLERYRPELLEQMEVAVTAMSN
ncbi:hypothetical protein ACFLQN_04830 [Candidatus Aenigmatarchaeota archaeon]